MKKQLALLIAAAMTLTLAACGASGSTGSASSAAPDHTITLGVFEPKTGASGIREELGIAYAQSLRLCLPAVGPGRWAGLEGPVDRRGRLE